MRRINFSLETEILELINVPMFDGTPCFMVCTVSNSKLKSNYKILHTSNYTSPVVDIKNHRAKFGKAGQYSTAFRIQAQTNSKGELLSDKWLCISFLIKHNKRQELLGSLTVNLTDYINEKSKKEVRFLLENSKTNSIVKLSIFIKHLTDDGSILYQTSKTSSGTVSDNNGLCSDLSVMNTISESPNVSPTKSVGKSLRVPSPTVQKHSENILEKVLSKTSHTMSNASNISISTDTSTGNNNPTNYNNSINSNAYSGAASNGSLITGGSKSPTSSRFGRAVTTSMSRMHVEGSTSKKDDSYKELNTQSLMNEAYEAATKETSLLDELINKSYRFSWQLRCIPYEEFTPVECVRDIVEKNGNGWKKNEEGIDMIDIVENEYREYSMPNNEAGYLLQNRNAPSKNSDSISAKYSSHDADIFADFRGGEHSQHEGYSDNLHLQTDSESESDSDDLFNAYYKNNMQRPTKIKRFKPLTEAEVREDLRSWHIGVTE